jgi:hypothetical protein
MAQESEVIIQLTARTEAAESAIKKLEAQLNKTKVAAAKVNDDGIEKIVKNGGAMGLLNDLTGGLAMQFKDAYESIQLTNTGLKGMRAALLATGIGAAVVAIGLLAANFDRVKEALFPVNAEAERFLDIQKKAIEQSAKEISTLEVLRSRINSQNTTQKERAAIIADLQKKYPAFLENINAEKAGYDEINKAINSINDALIKKSTLSVVQDELSELIKKQRELNAENEKTIQATNQVFLESEQKWGSLSEQQIKERDGLIQRQKERYEKESAEITKTIEKTTQEVMSLQNELSGMFEAQSAETTAVTQKAVESQSELLKKREKDEVDSIDRVTQKQRDAYDQRTQAQKEAHEQERMNRAVAIEGAEQDAQKDLAMMKQRAKDEAEYKAGLQQSGFALAGQLNDLLFSRQGEQSKEGFRIAKALAVSEAGLNTYKAASAAYATAAASPYTLINPAYPFIQAGIATAFGLAQVAKIASQKYGGGAQGGGGGGSAPGGFGGGAPTPTNPSPAIDFSFLNQNQPAQTYVIAGDVKTANEANQKIKDQSVL